MYQDYTDYTVGGEAPGADMTQNGMSGDTQPYVPSDPELRYEQPVEAPAYTAPVYTAPQAASDVYGQPVTRAFAGGSSDAAQEPQAKPEKKKAGWTGKKVVALALCCAIIGGAMGFGGSYLGNRVFRNQSGPAAPSTNVTEMIEGDRESTVIELSEIDTSKQMTPAEVYAANVNSTVGITTSITTNYWGYQSTAAAAGSGFIITADGYILTNYHVIENSNSVNVALYNGDTYEATIVGFDESNDIAVLKIDAKGLTPVVLGDSDNLNVGDTVIAIGNPLGELTFSLTQGVISALDREVTFSNGSSMDLIQTDCAINSGNSGGALFNLYGEVIGITNAKYSSSGYGTEASIDNIGFAIPMNQVRTIVSDIIEKGYTTKPYIGVSVGNVSEESQNYGTPKGAAVGEVTEGGPAAQAGLRVNDIITAANGTEITGSSDLVDVVKECQPGDKLVLTVYRQGEVVEITVTVGEKIQSATEKAASQQQDQQSGTQDQQGDSQDQQGQGGWFNFDPFSFFGNGGSNMG